MSQQALNTQWSHKKINTQRSHTGNRTCPKRGRRKILAQQGSGQEESKTVTSVNTDIKNSRINRLIQADWAICSGFSDNGKASVIIMTQHVVDTTKPKKKRKGNKKDKTHHPRQKDDLRGMVSLSFTEAGQMLDMLQEDIHPLTGTISLKAEKKSEQLSTAIQAAHNLMKSESVPVSNIKDDAPLTRAPKKERMLAVV